MLTFSFDASLYFFQFVTGDEPTTMHNDTTDLIDLMIEDTKGRAIYLAVREIGDKTRSSQTINVLKRHPEILDFTLGVYTKCDDLVTRKIKLKMEEKTDLRHGYVATMNAPPSTHSSHNSLESNDLFIQANEEINYFKDNNLSHLLEKKLATCNVLVDKVGDMYHTHLLETWIPTTLALIYQKNRKLEEQDKLMGLPRGHILNETTTPIVRILVAKVSVSIVAKVHAEQEDRLFNTVLVPLETSLIKMLSDYINAVKKEVQYFKSSTTNGEKKQGEENGQEKNKSQIYLFMTDVIRSKQEQLIQSIAPVINEACEKIWAVPAEQIMKQLKTDPSNVKIGRFPKFAFAVIEMLKSKINKNDIRQLQKDARDKLDILAQQLVQPKFQLKQKQLSMHYTEVKDVVDILMAVLVQGMEKVTTCESLTNEETLDIANNVQDWTEECVDARKDVLTRLHATGVLERKMNLVIDELVGSGSVDREEMLKRVEDIKLTDEVSIKEAKEAEWKREKPAREKAAREKAAREKAAKERRHTGVWKTSWTKSKSWTCCGSKDKESIECSEEWRAKTRWKSGKPTESDILARVEAAENKITKNYGGGNGIYYGQMEGGSDGNRHGYGTFTYANSTNYVGEWKDAKKTGNGTETYADGSKYVGQFKNGRRHGNGTYTYANGDTYLGELNNNKKHGHGTTTKADGTIQHSGEWENDEPTEQSKSKVEGKKSNQKSKLKIQVLGWRKCTKFKKDSRSYIEYEIHIEDEAHDETAWSTWQRYSSLQALHVNFVQSSNGRMNWGMNDIAFPKKKNVKSRFRSVPRP